jgi:hypothetical protein
MLMQNAAIAMCQPVRAWGAIQYARAPAHSTLLVHIVYHRSRRGEHKRYGNVTRYICNTVMLSAAVDVHQVLQCLTCPSSLPGCCVRGDREGTGRIKVECSCSSMHQVSTGAGDLGTRDRQKDLAGLPCRYPKYVWSIQSPV